MKASAVHYIKKLLGITRWYYLRDFIVYLLLSGKQKQQLNFFPGTQAKFHKAKQYKDIHSFVSTFARREPRRRVGILNYTPVVLGDILAYNVGMNQCLNHLGLEGQIELVLFNIENVYRGVQGWWQASGLEQGQNAGGWKKEADRLVEYMESLFRANPRVGGIKYRDQYIPDETDFAIHRDRYFFPNGRSVGLSQIEDWIVFFRRLHPDSYGTEYEILKPERKQELARAIRGRLGEDSIIIAVQLRKSIQTTGTSTRRNPDLQKYRQTIQRLSETDSRLKFIVIHDRHSQMNVPPVEILTASPNVFDVAQIIPDGILNQLALIEVSDLFLGCSSGPAFWAHYKNRPAVLGSYRFDYPWLYENGVFLLGSSRQMLIPEDSTDTIFKAVRGILERTHTRLPQK